MSNTIDETFKTFHRVLSFAGISIFAKQNWDSRIWLSWQIFNFITGVLCLIFTTGFVVANFSDFDLCIDGACIWTTGAIMTITFGVCLTFRKDFRDYLNEIAFKEPMLKMPLIENVLIFRQNTAKLRELRELVCNSHKNFLRYMKSLLKVYLTYVTAIVTLYLLNPLYDMIMSDVETKRFLAFEMWFPWSLQNLNVYIVSLIFNVYCAHLCCIAYPGFQVTVILLLWQLIRQLRILSFILKHLDELVLEMTGERNDRWEAYCTIILSECVDHYIRLRRFSNKLNVICRPFYLTLIIVAIMLVCVCSVKIATAKSKISLDTSKYYVHELCFIQIVLIFCALGQKVEDECDNLQRAVTEKWYIYEKRHRTNIRIFTIALSQKMPIYVFGSITLSFSTFTWFIKTGMSFFTFVMAVVEEDVC